MKLSNKIHIHPFAYFIILASLLTGLFKYLLIIGSIVLIHELGHVLIAKIFKRKITSITFLPFGGLIKMDSYISEDIFEDILISIGGILFQLLLAVITQFLYKLDIIDFELFKFINLYNTLIISFNLLPINPLDGAKMVKLFEELFIPFKKTFILSFVISSCTLFLFAIFKFDTMRDNLFIFIFLVYSILEEMKNRKYILNRFYIERMNRDFNFNKKIHIKSKDEMYKNRNNIINGRNEKIFLLREYRVK